MKMWILLVSILAAWAEMSMGLLAVETNVSLDSVRSDFEKARAGVVDEFAGKVSQLDAEYLSSLAKLQKSLEERGEKAQAHAVAGEIERFQREKRVFEEASAQTLMVLQSVQSNYRKQVTQLRADQARMIKTASDAVAAKPDSSAAVKKEPGQQDKVQVATAEAMPRDGSEKRNHFAVGAQVSTSSTHTGEPGEMEAAALVDGDLFTRWSSDYTQPQEVILTFAQPAKLARMRLHWERAAATKYCVYVSQDGKAWSSVYLYMHAVQGEPASRVDEIALNNVEAKQIKLDLQSCINKEWGFSLYEVEVIKSEQP